MQNLYIAISVSSILKIRCTKAFCLKYKEIATRAHWSSLVRVDRWGWDSAETAPHKSAPCGGLGGAETREHFSHMIF